MTSTHDDLDLDDKVANDDEKHEVDQDLYIASHGKVPRTGGPYSDDLAREEAEKWRAKAEDREPDYDNPPATAGTLLVPKQYLRETDTDKVHFSDQVEVVNEPVQTVKVDVTSAEHTKPDPTQVAWDNDQSKVDALNARKVLDEAGQPDPTEGYMSDSVRGYAATTPENVNKKPEEKQPNDKDKSATKKAASSSSSKK
jgi:hypothetical protein